MYVVNWNILGLSNFGFDIFNKRSALPFRCNIPGHGVIPSLAASGSPTFIAFVPAITSHFLSRSLQVWRNSIFKSINSPLCYLLNH